MRLNQRSLSRLGLPLALSLAGLLFSQADRKSSSAAKNNATPGRRTFNSTCAGCHGLDGRGSDKAVNISVNARAQRFSDSQLVDIISRGVPGTGMPAFRTLTASQVGAVVAYLRTLQGHRVSTSLPGDAKRGKEIFFGKGDCASCHMIAGHGGFLGPDLTNQSAASSAQAIRDQIVLSPRIPQHGYRTAVLTTANGDQLEGVVRNEDNFSVQLQTTDGRFHFLKRSELGTLKYAPGSLMPGNYRDRLSDRELDDLVSYLMTTGNANGRTPPSNEWDDLE